MYWAYRRCRRGLPSRSGALLLTDTDGPWYVRASQGVKDAPYVFGGKVVAEQKYYYSQNGVTWLDLAPLDDVTYARASTISGMLSGQPGKKYRVEEPAPVVEGETPAPEAEVRIVESAVHRVSLFGRRPVLTLRSTYRVRKAMSPQPPSRSSSSSQRRSVCAS